MKTNETITWNPFPFLDFLKFDPNDFVGQRYLVTLGPNMNGNVTVLEFSPVK